MEQMNASRAVQEHGQGLRSPRSKTLVFCTSYCTSRDRWNARYRRWLDAIRQSGLIVDQILIIDDASEILPDWPDLQIIEENSGWTPTCSTALFHFTAHLGRRSIIDCPGWYRSFGFAAVFAQVNGFDKVIHIESDAFLISRRIVNYVNSTNEGWTAFWCKRWKFPEPAIQVIAGKAIMLFRTTTSRPQTDMIEKQLPFTRVERSFVGDRYGEYADRIPRYADYATQTIEDAPAEYFWWLTESAPTGSRRMLSYILNFAREFFRFVQKLLRFAQKPLPAKWMAIKATMHHGTAQRKFLAEVRQREEVSLAKLLQREDARDAG